MKHHAHTLIYLACLAIAWLLCSCRSTLQNNRSTQEQSNLSITDSALRIRTEDTYSRFNLNQNKRVKTGKLKLTSTQRNQQTHLPDYPQYRISRLKGARQRSKLCFRKMTLHVYLINRKQRLTSRFSKTNNPNPKRMPAVLSRTELMMDSSMA